MTQTTGGGLLNDYNSSVVSDTFHILEFVCHNFFKYEDIYSKITKFVTIAK